MHREFLIRYYPVWVRDGGGTAESLADYLLSRWGMVQGAHDERVMRAGFGKPRPMLASRSCWRDAHDNCKLIECQCTCHFIPTVTPTLRGK